MLDPEDHPFYEMVLRMVLWGDTQEKVIEKLGYNRVEGHEAQALYHAARKERITTIRRDYWKKFRIGSGLVLASVGLFVSFLMIGIIPRLVIYVAAGLLGIGSWTLIDGLAGVLMAGQRQGPLADEY